ncbi:hypothetical protein [Saccharopolyspora hattusasensis]|uniref:hypothetical protein n=1 Tax=Saccharopolyspora hattusasensis TaxID=1128679 RepID=UPI003D97CB70
MAWEWVAPVGTVVGASITAGFGGWFGGRQSRKNQERQHEFEKQTALTEQGREKAREAIAALRHLQRHQSTVVEWSNVTPAGDLDPAREQHERLGEAVEYFNDETVRRQVELVYNSLHASYVVTRLGHLTIANPELMISRACEEGRAVIGRYLRGEPAQESTFMADLRHAYDSGMDNMQREYEDWERLQRDAETPNTD